MAEAELITRAVQAESGFKEFGEEELQLFR
jgi:hypothetical protein